MSMFDRIARIAAAAVCSLVLTTLAVGSAIGPVGASGATAVYAAAGGGDRAHG